MIMIELPEAFVLARQVNSILTGKRIRNVIANQSPHKFAWYSGDPANYPKLLNGKTIGLAAAYGGHIEIKIDDMVLVISTGMIYHPAGVKLPKKHQLLLEFEDYSVLTASVQMWGVLLCFPEGVSSGLPDYRLAKIKPSPLTDPFDRSYFLSLFGESTGKLSVKAFLATEQRIPGLGNGVLQDILWTARIHPKYNMARLSEEEIEGIFTSVKTVLKEMSFRGGRDTERDLFGCAGGYRTILSKKTVGKACPVCGTVIRKEPYLGGSIYCCERCQRL
jgi:formamidopyrimidine-DNA glycosylase